MARRRDATRVIFDILWVVKRGVSKTQVMYKANLSFPLVQEYMSFLTIKALVETSIDVHGTATYQLTDKGTALLNLLSQVERELDGFFSRPLLTIVPSEPEPSLRKLLSEYEQKFQVRNRS